MVQRRTVPCAFAAALTAVDLPPKAGTRVVKLLVERTGAPEPPPWHRSPARPISPDLRIGPGT
jgi:hypothetical protein